VDWGQLERNSKRLQEEVGLKPGQLSGVLVAGALTGIFLPEVRFWYIAVRMSAVSLSHPVFSIMTEKVDESEIYIYD
jgi:hypothetical protein